MFCLGCCGGVTLGGGGCVIGVLVFVCVGFVFDLVMKVVVADDVGYVVSHLCCNVLCLLDCLVFCTV